MELCRDVPAEGVVIGGNGSGLRGQRANKLFPTLVEGDQFGGPAGVPGWRRVPGGRRGQTSERETGSYWGGGIEDCWPSTHWVVGL